VLLGGEIDVQVDYTYEDDAFDAEKGHCVVAGGSGRGYTVAMQDERCGGV